MNVFVVKKIEKKIGVKKGFFFFFPSFFYLCYEICVVCMRMNSSKLWDFERWLVVMDEGRMLEHAKEIIIHI